MKVYITPSIQHSPYGIRRVIEAMHKYLPQFGVQVTDNIDEADCVNVHGTSWVDFQNKPLCYSSHGMYWQELNWSDGYLQANQYMIDNMVRAQAIITPSQWVRHAFTRGLLRNPHVVYHGVDTDEWKPGQNHGFVIWNKARTDIVSNPDDLDKIASKLPDVGFLTTFGTPSNNVQVTGALLYNQMKDAVSKAGVYLATARETFGIGTLEALSCGVPVAGWAHGGQVEIIKQGETGYLAPYGDYDALGECINLCIQERDRLSANARQDVVERWQWADKIEQYANIFKGVVEEWNRERPKVTVIITNHNLEQYLPECLQSIKHQTLQDFECVIVDDASNTDAAFHAMLPFMRDANFRYVETPYNLKLSGARNYGFQAANGRYIIYLDADDRLSPNALELLCNALDNKPEIHIAYGHLDLLNEDGSHRGRGDWPFPEFNWHGQMAHLNQLPYCAMMRREVMENSGGYRLRDWRAEDSSLWCRLTSFGFRAAKVTEESILQYRIRPNSKGQLERQNGHDDGDWTSWYSWRLGANNAQEGFDMLERGKQPPHALVPFGAQGSSLKHCWPVWSHHTPLVSVIIPVGAKHVPYLIDALDSLLAQTMPFWEVVVVNDTGNPLELPYAPFARVIDNGTHNIADSRNKGIEAAKASLVFFLDCDDLLIPTALYDMLVEFIRNDGSRYVYSDWYGIMPGKEVERQSCRDFERDGRGIHPVSILIPKDWCTAIGGYDNQVAGWEDWEFAVKLQVNGYCGVRLPKHLLVYRLHSGQRREQSLEDAGMTLPWLEERYEGYYNGEKQMAGCCGGNGDIILEAKKAMGLLGETPEGKPVTSSGQIRIEYIGVKQGSITVHHAMGKSLSREYKLGNNNLHRYADATPEDAKLLVEAGIAKYVRLETIDLSQAAQPQFEVPQVPKVEEVANGDVFQAFTEYQAAIVPITQEEKPEWADEIEQQAITDMNLTQLRLHLVGKTVSELQAIRNQEVTGKNRKGALTSIDEMLNDAQRVG